MRVICRTTMSLSRNLAAVARVSVAHRSVLGIPVELTAFVILSFIALILRARFLVGLTPSGRTQFR